MYLSMENIFEICSIPDPGQKFRVAYNIWKPFVYKRWEHFVFNNQEDVANVNYFRDVTDYEFIGDTKASILDGIDIQV